jgi:hypothetical protein
MDGGTVKDLGWFFLHEPFTPTFWAAMILIVAGVVLGRRIGRKFQSSLRGECRVCAAPGLKATATLEWSLRDRTKTGMHSLHLACERQS